MFKKAIVSISNLIDFFIADTFKNETDMRYKARLLVGCLLSFVISIIGFGPYYSSIDGLSTEAILFYFIFAVPIFLYYLIMLWNTRQGKYYNFTAFSTVASTVIILFGGILVTGGPAKTEVLPMIVVPVVLAFIMLGKRAGVFWMISVATINYILVAMDYFDFQFINVAAPEAVKQLRIFNWSYSFFIVISLVMVYESMNSRLTKERDAEREKFRHMAFHDVLTGLPNRKYFDEAITSTISLADRTNTCVGIALLDLNGFKPINDEIGHEAGDIVLKVVSERMRDALRKSDQVSRIGGDEFAFILNNVSSNEDVANVCNKILSAIAEPIVFAHKAKIRLNVTGSLGIALFPSDSRDENELRVFSDKAMFAAKRNQKGWCLYNQIDKNP